MAKLYLIDGNAYIHRAYHALPPLSTSGGVMVNAVYGFVKMVLKTIKKQKPDYLAVCFDYPAKNFRHERYTDYKATRKELDDDLKTQMPIARDAVKAMGIAQVEKEGFEADDIIATLAKRAEKNGFEVVIVTGDKDILQLVNDNIKVYNEHKGVLYDRNRVHEKYGLYPEQLNDMFAMMGDSSDNVPGIKGIGEKTAVKLINEYGSVENVIKNADKLKGKVQERVLEHKDDAIMSKELVTLHPDVDLSLGVEDFKLKGVDNRGLFEFAKKYEFTSLFKETGGREQGEGNSKPSCANPPSLKLRMDSASEGQAESPGPEVNLTIENKDISFKTEIIDTKNKLDGLIRLLQKQKNITLDVESDSIDAMAANLVGISIAFNKEIAYYLPLGHSSLDSGNQLSKDDLMGQFKEVLENEDIKKTGHNIKYDYIVLKNFGINIRGIYFDTMVASYCLNPSLNKHGLKTLALEHFAYRMTEIEELIGRASKQTTFDTVDIDRASKYASADAMLTFLLAKKFKKQLEDKNLINLFFDVEMPMVKVLSSMEMYGFKIDVPYLKKLDNEFKVKLGKLEKDIYELAEIEFNINSTKQLGHILFEKLGLPVIKKTKTGHSTDESVLSTLSAMHKLPKILLEYRQLQKLISTYASSLIGLINNKTGRLHTSFNQTVTATGRLSSSSPNLQNIPVRGEYGKKIRRSFVPEIGNVFVSADYSQIDLRVLAHISKDKNMVQAFKCGLDIHSSTASEVFGVDVNNVPSDVRRTAKSINFGIVYGISPFGLANQLGIGNAEAKQYIDSYFNKYSGVKAWIDRNIKDVKIKGFVSTLLGRVRYIPEINSKNGNIRGFAERMAMNTPIQGTSADIIKLAMIKIHQKLLDKTHYAKMLVQVHDDLLFEVKEGSEKEIIDIIKYEMENAVKLDVPLKVDVKSGVNWADMKEIDE